ncbi:MAG: hypothetical protein QG549_813 [Patescibacteria group bacterium]|nr:hypothetical protein [Patescibacteria group bacterium]
MTDSLTILNIIIAGVAIALGLFLLFGRERDRQRLLFAVLSITSGIWILANYFGGATTYDFVLLDYVSGTYLGLFFWMSSREIAQRALGTMRPRGGLWTFATISASSAATLLVVLILLGMIIDGPLYILYPLIIVSLVLLGVYHLVYAFLKSHNAVQKTRLKFVMAGLLVAFIFIAIPNLILENILPKGSAILRVSYDGAYVGILIFLALSTYAIVRHGLFDIKLAAVRSAAYLLSIATLSAIYYAAAYVVSITLFRGEMTSAISLSPVNIFLALILAFVFQPIKQFFDKMTNDIFYRDSYKNDEFFAELSQLLASTTNLRGLLERVSKQLMATFKSEQVFFFLYYSGSNDHYMSAGTERHTKMPMYDARLLDEYVSTSKYRVILTDLISDNPTIHKMLQSHRIGLVLPLRQGEKIAGYVLMGDHLTSYYTKRDLSVLVTVSNELIIAIQNAVSLHEVTELNATLQQRIDVATKELRSSNAQLKHLDEVKDEFMSMASHQLRTPLTSIKGYLSMVIEGDAGTVTPQQQKLLQEAYNSSERMVRLIADFLNVSRLQTGKFIVDKAPIDMKDVVRSEVKDLELIAASHNMKLRLNVGKQPMPIFADEGKIRQVVMNFIDNAIYYSHPKSTIIINLERVKNEAALTVVDTGIGVPEKEQAKLFTKFFRAGNARKARPDGTGVGLYLARRVVTAHGGSIIFSSKEGKGSTFGFRLPIDTNPAHHVGVEEPEEAAAIAS